MEQHEVKTSLRRKCFRTLLKSTTLFSLSWECIIYLPVPAFLRRKTIRDISTYLDSFVLKSKTVETLDRFLGVFRLFIVDKAVAETLACTKIYCHITFWFIFCCCYIVVNKDDLSVRPLADPRPTIPRPSEVYPPLSRNRRDILSQHLIRLFVMLYIRGVCTDWQKSRVPAKLQHDVINSHYEHFKMLLRSDHE